MRLDDHTLDIISRQAPLDYMSWAEQPPDTVPTPFQAWTEACGMEGGHEGIPMGAYIVIGGDTKQGKTLFALQCMGCALLSGRDIGFVNLEMSVQQLQIRLYSQLTGIPAYRIEPGRGYSAQHAAEAARWFEEAQSQGHRKFLVNTEPFLELSDMVWLMENWHDTYGCKVFCVDYMQLCEAAHEEGIAGETKEISKRIRLFCREKQVVVFAVSQFNNTGGNDRTQSPHAGSLYGGRRIAQDSTQTILIDHSRRLQTPEGKTRTWLIMPYNRIGPPVEIPIEWEWKTMTARQGLPDEEREWPGSE